MKSCESSFCQIEKVLAKRKSNRGLKKTVKDSAKLCANSREHGPCSYILNCYNVRLNIVKRMSSFSSKWLRAAKLLIFGNCWRNVFLTHLLLRRRV